MLLRSSDYFLKHGVAHLSLRPLAAAVGTSARMLVHHFGSKEELIAAVMEQMRTRLQSSFEPLVQANTKTKPGDIMLSFWKTLMKKEFQPYLRLLFEVQILAIQNPRRYKRYLVDSSATWIALIRQALPPGENNAAWATLCMAVIDGLILEYLSTGNRRRTSQSIELFLGLLRRRAA